MCGPGRGRRTLNKLRIGSVPYLNARPLVEGLCGDPSVAYLEAVPSRLAGLLREGAVDVALVSSIEALSAGFDRIVDGYCIASRGAVMSVRVIGREDPRLARSVALDGASLTAARLTRIVYERFLDRQGVLFRPAGIGPIPEDAGCDATLLIGDTALKRPFDPAHDLDLGVVWTDATGLPFVWAVWLLREGVDQAAVLPVLSRAAERGAARIEAAVEQAARELSIEPDLAREYLTRAMWYRLGPEELTGLQRFCTLAGRDAEHPIRCADPA